MGKRIICSVCGKEFDLKKDERYTGFEKGLLGGTYYDCYDCPNCGAQYAAQIRLEKCTDAEDTAAAGYPAK